LRGLTLPPETPAAAPPAILIDLTPLPAPAAQAAAAEPENTPLPLEPPPGPPELVEPPQPKPVEHQPPPPRPKPAKQALLRPNPVEQPAPAATASLAPAPIPQPVAPQPSPAANAPSPAAVQSWQQALLVHLERHKRYPRASRLRGEQGVAQVLFSIDRQGRVASLRLQRSSGHDSLDEETLRLVERAQPLPVPPEMPGGIVEVSVPVRFFLN